MSSYGARGIRMPNQLRASVRCHDPRHDRLGQLHHDPLTITDDLGGNPENSKIRERFPSSDVGTIETVKASKSTEIKLKLESILAYRYLSVGST